MADKNIKRLIDQMPADMKAEADENLKLMDEFLTAKDFLLKSGAISQEELTIIQTTHDLFKKLLKPDDKS